MDPALKEFGSKIGGGGIYFRPKSLTDKVIRVRPLPWLYKGKITVIVPMMEGWVETTDPKTKKKGQKPVRFALGEEIPEDLNWTRGEFGGKETSGVPKAVFAFLFYHKAAKRIHLISSDKVGLNEPIFSYLNDEEESYIPDLSQVDLLLSKPDDRTYKCEASPTGGGPLSSEMIAALEHFGPFDWEKYLKGEDPFEEGGYMWQHVQEAMGKPSQQIKQETPKERVVDNATAKKIMDSPEMKEWRNQKTPQGRNLGDLSLPDLQALKTVIEEKGKTSHNLYFFVKYGVEHFEERPDEGTSVKKLNDMDDIDF